MQEVKDMDLRQRATLVTGVLVVVLVTFLVLWTLLAYNSCRALHSVDHCLMVSR